ncbi:MAG: hypothetical protein JSW26_12370, partial [Desulfobacterales bacterium]
MWQSRVNKACKGILQFFIDIYCHIVELINVHNSLARIPCRLACRAASTGVNNVTAKISLLTEYLSYA